MNRPANPFVLLLLWAFVVTGAVLFLWRGCLRGIHDGNDFATVYAASRAFLQGSSSYRIENLVAVYEAASGTPEFAPRQNVTPSVYPPTTFVPLLPFAVAPWPLARILWMLFSAIVTLWMFGELIRFGRQVMHQENCKPGITEYLLLGGLLLAFAPLHTGLSKGQPAIVAGVCIVVGVFWASQKRYQDAGILLGLAIALKPLLGMGYLAYYALVRWYRLCFATVGTLAVLTVAALLGLARADSGWLPVYLNNVAVFSARGGINSPDLANSLRYHLINIQPLVVDLFGENAAVNLVSTAIVGMLAVLLIVTAQKQEYKPGKLLSNDLLVLSMITILDLLSVYHRFYDAVLLVLPMTWAVSQWATAPKRSLTVLLVLAFFFVPGAICLQQWADAGLIPTALSGSWWWNAFILPHQTWALIALFFILWRIFKNKNLPAVATLQTDG